MGKNFILKDGCKTSHLKNLGSFNHLEEDQEIVLAWDLLLWKSSLESWK